MSSCEFVYTQIRSRSENVMRLVVKYFTVSFKNPDGFTHTAPL